MINYFEINKNEFRPVIYFDTKSYTKTEYGLCPQGDRSYLKLCYKALQKIYTFDNQIYYSLE
jgi:hypothetical protein